MSEGVPASVVELERRHIRGRFRRIAVDHRALKAAVEEPFGPAFDRDRWAELFDSDDPADVNTVSPVVSAFERIVNGVVEAARAGLSGSGVAQPVGTADSVRNDLARVRDDGGLSDTQFDLLVALSRTRNELQHDDIEVSADDARDAVRKLQHNLPALTRALNSWFARYELGVPERP